MVIGLLAITAIPVVTGVSLGVNEQRKANERKEDERRMARFHIDVELDVDDPEELEEYDALPGTRIVLRDNKVYIDDPIAANRKTEAHVGQAFYVDYPEPEHMKHLNRGLGLVTTVSDNPPMLNWIYVDNDTYQLKYGNRTQSCEHVVGPWDWTDDEKTVTLEQSSGFFAVEDEEGAWEVYFDRDGDGLEDVLDDLGIWDSLVLPIKLKRTLLEPTQKDNNKNRTS